MNTTVEGQIVLRWKKVGRWVVYRAVMTTYPDNKAGITILNGTKMKLILYVLDPNKRYYFRIASTLFAGMSGYSP